MRKWILGIIALAFVACSANASDGDAGLLPDRGRTDADPGASSVDAGGPLDAGRPLDAAEPLTDAGPSPDAGGAVDGGPDCGICDDGDPGTFDYCDPQTGSCGSCEPRGRGCCTASYSCDDGDATTVDACDIFSGLCYHFGTGPGGRTCDDAHPLVIGEEIVGHVPYAFSCGDEIRRFTLTLPEEADVTIRLRPTAVYGSAFACGADPFGDPGVPDLIETMVEFRLFRECGDDESEIDPITACLTVCDEARERTFPELSAGTYTVEVTIAQFELAHEFDTRIEYRLIAEAMSP